MDDPDPGGNLGDDLEEIGTVIEDNVAVQSEEKVNARVNVRILFICATKNFARPVLMYTLRKHAHATYSNFSCP